MDSPLNKFKHEILDSEIALDEHDKWSRHFSNIFLGGRPMGDE